MVDTNLDSFLNFATVVAVAAAAVVAAVAVDYNRSLNEDYFMESLTGKLTLGELASLPGSGLAQLVTLVQAAVPFAFAAAAFVADTVEIVLVYANR